MGEFELIRGGESTRLIGERVAGVDLKIKEQIWDLAYTNILTDLYDRGETAKVAQIGGCAFHQLKDGMLVNGTALAVDKKTGMTVGDIVVEKGVAAIREEIPYLETLITKSAKKKTVINEAQALSWLLNLAKSHSKHNYWKELPGWAGDLQLVAVTHKSIG